MIEFSQDVRPSMALELEAHEGQAGQAPLSAENLFRLAAGGPSWAVRLDGRLVAIGGHTPVWPGRTILWGYLGANCGPALPVMTKEIRRQIGDMRVEFPRMEAYAERHHAEGHRWLKLLGFKQEGLMRKFYNGRDYVLYAKVT
jgi:hypothetical protein